MTDEERDTALTDEELDLYGFVSASTRRESIVTSLMEDPMTPTQLSEQTDIRLNHVSNLLSELADEELVRCVNPDRERGRVYRLTDVGETVGEKVVSR